MIKKTRKETVELRVGSILQHRMELPKKDQQYYESLKKGYAGESEFDTWLEQLNAPCIILNDLLLEHNHTFFQVDSLIISDQKIYLFEVKNFEGNFYIENDQWYSSRHNEVKNPLLQMKRTELLLRQFLHRLKWNLPIESYLIFVNPTFFLYQAPRDLPALFYYQIPRFFSRLNKSLSQYSPKLDDLADQIISRNITNPFSPQILNYTYEQLKKGIICPECGEALLLVGEKALSCRTCHLVESIEIGVLRSLDEYRLLFPERKITNVGVMDWCQVIQSQNTIRRILKKHYKQKGHGKYTYYIPLNN